MRKTLLFILAISFLGTGYAQNLYKQSLPKSSSEPVNLQNLSELQTVDAVAVPFAMPPVKASGNILLTEGFETTPSFNLPEGWTSNATDPTDVENAWVILSNSEATTALAHTGDKAAHIKYNFDAAHDAWMFTNGITLTAGTSYKISFWLKLEGYGSYKERLAVKIGASASAAGMTELLFDNAGINYSPWTLISGIYTPATTRTYYLGFYAYSDAGANYIAIDDVSVEIVPENDLEILANAFLYSQIPVSQLFPALSTKARNIGTQTQTNVTFSATLNGSPAGTGTPVIASLAFGETSAAMTIAPAAGVTLGDNTIVYTVTQNETDENPENNSATFAFTGTRNVLALDEATVSGVGVGNTAPISFGNILEITTAAKASQVIVGFNNSTVAIGDTYEIRLYRMSGELSLAAMPLFIQEATRPASGFVIVDVPATSLVPDRYFLCVKQTTNNNIGVPHDGNTAKSLYSINTENGTLQGYPTLGAAAIRMVTEVDVCGGTLSDLNAVPGYTSVTCTWTGSGFLSYLVTLSDGTNTYTQTTFDTNIVFNGIPSATTYTWSVRGRCDAINFTTENGTEFVTSDCAISTFPYEEGFESYGENMHPCWEQELGTANAFTWRVRTAAFMHGLSDVYPYEGSYLAELYGNEPDGRQTKLIMPVMDLTSLTNPTLKFRHIQKPWKTTGSSDQDVLRVYYKNSKEGTWTLLKTYDEEVAEWTEQVIALPEPSDDYYVAFEGTIYFGFGIQLDNISVVDYISETDAEIVRIIAPISGIQTDLTDSEEVTVLIRNNDSEPLSGFDVKLELNGSVIATEPYPGTISILGEEEYTFNAKLNLSAAAAYTVTVTVIADNDQNPDNDSKTVTLTNVICSTVETFPWEEGFEEDVFPPVCWSTYNEGGVSDWGRNTDDEITGIPPGINSGHGSAWHNRNGASDDWLITLPIALPATGAYELEFYTHTQFASGYSGVWVSTDSDSPASGDFVEIKSLTGSEVTFGMQKISVSLSDYAGETIYIAFRYKGTNHRWFIDDVKISLPPQYTVAVSANSDAGGSVTGGGTYNSGDEATVTATANAHYNFVNWTENGTPVSTDAAYTFTVTGDRTLAANFVATTPVLTGITVNGTNIAVADNMSYMAACGEENVVLNLTSEGTIKVNGGNYTDGMSVAFSNDKAVISIVVSGATDKTYTLTVSKALGSAAMPMYVQRWGKTLAVVNNPANNGGHAFNEYKWYHNGILQANANGYILLNNRPATEYAAEVNSTKTGVWHKLCPNVKSQVQNEIVAYPNPVNAGQLLNLNLPEGTDKVNVHIYDMSGNLIRQQNGVHSAVTAPNQAGVYVIRIELPDGNVALQNILVE